MSSCRIERKRAHDREAQRASRAKTKAYIAHLEKTVADLTSSTGDDRATYLAQHASKQAEEIDSLQGLLNKIRALVQEASKGDASSSDDSRPPRLKAEGSVVESMFGDSSARIPFSARDASDSPSEDQWSIEGPRWINEVPKLPRREEPRRQTPSATSTARNLSVLGENVVCEETEDCTYVLRLNSAIKKVEQTSDNLSSPQEDEDILVRAIIQGWDAAERIHHFDIVWRFIRAYDEGLWYRAGQGERLATLWQMRNTMLHKINPKNQQQREISSFMAPTEYQKTRRQRPPVVDYFGWPAVRNHLLVQGIGKCTGVASIAFVKSFRFAWEYDLRDMYRVNRSTGIYSFSESFIRSCTDGSSFRMLHNDLIPYYVHPSLAQAAPMQSCTQQPSLAGSESDDSIDEEVIRVVDGELGHTSNLDIPTLESMLQGDRQVGGWIQNFDMGMANEVTPSQYAMDPFTLSHEAGLNQWPDP